MSARPAALLRRVWPPMKATLSTVDQAADETHLLEVKYDGYRALCAVAGGAVAIHSRNAIDRTADFPQIAGALAALPVGDAVLDGEVVPVSGNVVRGMQGFQDQRARARLVVFDLLWRDAADLRPLPLERRRALLEEIVPSRAAAGRPLALATRASGPPAAALERARGAGLEGLIAKRRGSRYTGGPGRDWLKLKVVHTQDVVLIGFTPLKRSGATAPAREVGALALAVRAAEGGYHYAGKVGTGMSAATRRKLWRLLSADRADAPPAADAPRLRDVRWVAPRHAAEVGFSEWTRDGRLRHPAFRGLRPDKSPAECVRERPR